MGAAKKQTDQTGFLHQRSDSFGKLPIELLHDQTITDGAKVLYAHMHWRYGQNCDNHEGRARMADFLGISETTITNRINELEMRNWVVTKYRSDDRGRTSNEYHVFEVQDDCLKWREQQAIPAPIIKVDFRKPRTGVGGRSTHKSKVGSETQVKVGSETQVKEPTKLELSIPLNSSSANPDSYDPDSVIQTQNLATEVAGTKLESVPDRTAPVSGNAVEPPSVAVVPPFRDAPARTRWIFPLEGNVAHLVRDANQPTVTLCGIRPLPSYAGMATPGKQQACPACLAKASNRAPEHMLPIAAWCNALEGKVPRTFDIGAFARVSQEWAEKGITADEVRCAGLLFRAWIEAHPAAPSVSWQVKNMRGNVDQALILHREGIEPSDVTAYVKELKADKFWSGKIVSFDNVCKNIPTWKVEQGPSAAKPVMVEHPDHPGEMITRGRYNIIMTEKKSMEALYGPKSTK